MDPNGDVQVSQPPTWNRLFGGLDKTSSTYVPKTGGEFREWIPWDSQSVKKNHLKKKQIQTKNNKWVFPKIGGTPPKSSILIGFSIIFTIHFGVPLFLETPKSNHSRPNRSRDLYIGGLSMYPTLLMMGILVIGTVNVYLFGLETVPYYREPMELRPQHISKNLCISNILDLLVGCLEKKSRNILPNGGLLVMYTMVESVKITLN